MRSRSLNPGLPSVVADTHIDGNCGQTKWSNLVFFFFFFCVVSQVLWGTMAIQVHANISTAAWGVIVWPTMRPAKGSVSAWITVNHTINLCAVQMESCTRTIVSSTGPLVLEDTGLPSCTVRSASTKVRAHMTFFEWRMCVVHWILYVLHHTLSDVLYARSLYPVGFSLIESDSHCDGH